MMTTVPGDLVLDPMCGSGTTGMVCRKMGLRAVLADEPEEYTQHAEKRLGLQRSIVAKEDFQKVVN